MDDAAFLRVLRAFVANEKSAFGFELREHEIWFSPLIDGNFFALNTGTVSGVSTPPGDCR